MKCSSRWFSLPVIAVLLMTCIGCGMKKARERARLDNALTCLWLANLTFLDSTHTNQKRGQWAPGPASWEELLPYYPEGLAETIDTLKANEVVVHWNYQVKDLRYRHAKSTGNFVSNDFILAYPKSALSEGGSVLLAMGTCEQMSADELKQKLAEQGIAN